MCPAHRDEAETNLAPISSIWVFATLIIAALLLYYSYTAYILAQIYSEAVILLVNISVAV